MCLRKWSKHFMPWLTLFMLPSVSLLMLTVSQNWMMHSSVSTNTVKCFKSAVCTQRDSIYPDNIPSSTTINLSERLVPQMGYVPQLLNQNTLKLLRSLGTNQTVSKLLVKCYSPTSASTSWLPCVLTLLVMGCCKEHVYHIPLRNLVHLAFGYVQVPILTPLQFIGIGALANESEIGHEPTAVVISSPDLELNADANEDNEGNAVSGPTVLAHVHLAKTTRK